MQKMPLEVTWAVSGGARGSPEGPRIIRPYLKLDDRVNLTQFFFKNEFLNPSTGMFTIPMQFSVKKYVDSWSQNVKRTILDPFLQKSSRA